MVDPKLEHLFLFRHPLHHNHICWPTIDEKSRALSLKISSFYMELIVSIVFNNRNS